MGISAQVVSFGATDPAAPAPAAGLDLFGAGSSASAPSSDAKAGGASLNVGELLAFAGSSPSKVSVAVRAPVCELLERCFGLCITRALCRG